MNWSSRLGRRVQRRLRQEIVLWLTTVDAAGRPQPRLVWFDWNGRNFLILSEPATGKVRHIARSSKVSLHLNSDPEGGDVAVILGTARLLKGKPDPARIKRYIRKYRAGIKGIGMTPASFLATYSTPINVTPTAVRGL